MTEEQLKKITSNLITDVFRNDNLRFLTTLHTYDELFDAIDYLTDVIASLHNLLYEEVTGKRYDYMFHWSNKIGLDTKDDLFDPILRGEFDGKE